MLPWTGATQVRAKVSDWVASEQDESQLTDYIESRAPRWIKELEQIAQSALFQQGDCVPDYERAAKVLLCLLKPQPT